jgi:carboxypeptidase C (cathepsin A)
VVWRVNNNVAGYARTFDNLALVNVLRAGHLVPQDQPAAALDMIRRFIADQPWS